MKIMPKSIAPVRRTALSEQAAEWGQLPSAKQGSIEQHDTTKYMLSVNNSVYLPTCSLRATARQLRHITVAPHHRISFLADSWTKSPPLLGQ